MSDINVTSPIPVGPQWVSPNNRVLIHGRGNTYKTSMAIRMAVEAALKRIEETKKPATLTIILTEGNNDISFVPKIFGSKASHEDFFNELNEKGLYVNFCDIFKDFSVEPVLALIPALDKERENHLVLDSISELNYFKENWFSEMTTPDLLAQLSDLFNGIKIFVAHSYPFPKFVLPESADVTIPKMGPVGPHLDDETTSMIGLTLESSQDKTLDGVGVLTVVGGTSFLVGQNEYYRLSYQ